MNKKTQPFYHKSLKWLQTKYFEYKAPLFTGIIVGIVTFLFFLTNKFINHDETGGLFSKGDTISFGKWGLELIKLIFPDFSMPSLYGIISIILATLSACIFIKMFSIKSTLFRCLLTGIVVSFPSLVASMSFTTTSSSYTTAFFLSAVAAYLCSKGGAKNLAVAFVIMILSLSIYQVYVGLLAAMLVLYLIKIIINENTELSEIIKKGVAYVAFLIVVLVVYYALTIIIQYVSNVQMGGYAQDRLMNGESIPKRIFLAYRYFFSSVAIGSYGLVPTLFSQLVHISASVVIAVGLVITSYKKKSTGKIVLMWILVVLLPLAANCMFVIASSKAIHTMLLYGFIFIYILAILFAENNCGVKKYPHIFKNILSVMLVIVLATNVYVANKGFLKMYLSYEHTYAYFTQLICQVKMTPGFDENTKLALVGKNDNLIFDMDIFDINKTNGIDGNEVIYTYTRTQFINYYIGFDIQFATGSEIDEIKNTEDFKQMQEYPYYGSVQKINDCIVVKLSND